MKKILLTNLLVLCMSCNSPTKEITIESIKQNDLTEVDFIHFGDERYFEKCFIVKLEAHDESLLYGIDQLEIYKDQIYILDRQKKRLMVFDINGKYLHYIGKQGQGPEEYISISAFYIDNDIISLFDPMNQAVIHYKTSGDFYKKTKRGDNQNIDFIRKVIPINNKELLAYSSTNWYNNALYSIIDRDNYETIRNIRYYPYETKNATYYYSKQPFFKYNDEILLGMLFSDTLFKYKSRTILPEKIIENKQNISSDLLQARLEENDGDYASVFYPMNIEGIYNTGVSNIFENNRFLLCDFRSETNLLNAILFDKLNNKSLYVKEYCHCYPDLGEFFIATDNTVVRIWTNNNLTFFKDMIEKDEKLKNKYPKSVIDLVNQYDLEEDNPMLIFYEFKK